MDDGVIPQELEIDKGMNNVICIVFQHCLGSFWPLSKVANDFAVSFASFQGIYLNFLYNLQRVIDVSPLRLINTGGAITSLKSV